MKALTARQWIVPHQWMLVPTRQVDWISTRGGRLVWLANVFEGLGMGLYLVGLVVGEWWATLIGWFLLAFVTLPLRLISIGRPTRFWRAIPPFTKTWRTSWFARGTFFCTMFTLFGFLQVVTSLMIDQDVASGGALTAVNWVASVIAGVFAVCVVAYVAFAMRYCESVPFWNTLLLPVVRVITCIVSGIALLMAVGLATDGVDLDALEWASRVAVLVNIALIAVFLTHSLRRSPIAGFSARDLLVGPTARVFWVGIVGLGMVVPLVISIVSIFSERATVLLIVAVACHTIGAFALEYAVLKAGIYKPVVTKRSRRPGAVPSIAKEASWPSGR